jgi:hypothetical protein
VSDERQGWQDALAPTAECIDITRFGEELDPASRAHLASCPRCQAELALFREFQAEESSDEEAAAGRWIAGELQRRLQDSGNVVPFRPKRFQALYAAAAAIVLVLGASYWMQLREPSVDPGIGGSPVYRSARLDVIGPKGDIAQAPNELRWIAVPNASRYHVEISEVDATVVWSGDTTEPHVALPSAVIAQFAPGKTLLWDVQAFRGTEMLASSETQNVRVSVTPLRKTP